MSVSQLSGRLVPAFLFWWAKKPVEHCSMSEYDVSHRCQLFAELEHSALCASFIVQICFSRDTLEDVRVRLHKSVEKQKEKIRTRAHRMRESSSQYMQTIRESGTMKMQTIRESSSQYVKNIRSSGTNAIHGIRSSSSEYANRVRAGVVMGVEQVKYHVQSMKEFCGTGDMGQTISTVSMSTNVDMGETSEVVKQITFV